jgi:hypothetical protein
MILQFADFRVESTKLMRGKTLVISFKSLLTFWGSRSGTDRHDGDKMNEGEDILEPALPLWKEA